MVLRRWLGALAVFTLFFATLILAARMSGGFLPPPAIASLSLAQCEPNPLERHPARPDETRPG
jgi:hypothetical protein